MTDHAAPRIELPLDVVERLRAGLAARPKYLAIPIDTADVRAILAAADASTSHQEPGDPGWTCSDAWLDRVCDGEMEMLRQIKSLTADRDRLRAEVERLTALLTERGANAL